MANLNAEYIEGDNLKKIGLASHGENVRIHATAILSNPGNMRLGSDIRIDAFTILTARDIVIGSRVHIGSYSSITGRGRIELRDFAGLSQGVRMYSSSDDYSGNYLTNPTVDDNLKNVRTADIVLGRHVIIGTGSVILPGVEIEEGVALGALSLANKTLPAWGIYAGVPARYIKQRSRDCLRLEKAMSGA